MKPLTGLSSIIANKCKDFGGCIIDYTNPRIANTLLLLAANRSQVKTYCVCNKANYLIQNPIIINGDDFEVYAEIARAAYEYRLLVLSNYNKEEMLIKPWKRNAFIGDLFLLKDMFKGQVDEYFKGVIDLKDEFMVEIMNNNPKMADLYSKEIGVTHEELEWAIGINDIYDNIVFDNKDPAKHPRWYSLSLRQKIVVSKLNGRLLGL